MLRPYHQRIWQQLSPFVISYFLIKIDYLPVISIGEKMQNKRFQIKLNKK
jgi:hypothetical protein